MPLATNQMWLKTYGRLPWWREPAPSSLVKVYFDPNQPRDEIGQWIDTGGGGSKSLPGVESKGSPDKSAIRSWQMRGNPKNIDGYYVGGLGNLLGLKGKSANEFDNKVADLWAKHDVAKDTADMDARRTLTKELADSLATFESKYAATLSGIRGIRLEMDEFHRLNADTHRGREPLLVSSHWVLKALSGGDLSRARERYSSHDEAHFYQSGLSRQPTQYERKVNFVAIGSELDNLEAQGRERVRALLTGAKDKLLSLVSRKLADNSLTTRFVNDLELRGLGQLIPTLREILRSGFQQGQQSAKAEVKSAWTIEKRMSQENGNTTIKDAIRTLVAKHPELTKDQILGALKKLRDKKPELFTARKSDVHDYQVRHVLTGLPPEKALEFFESKATLWGAELRDPILRDAKSVLYNVIKTGQSLREAQAELERVFLPYLGDPDQMVDEEMLTPYRLETTIRTNVIEALNEGRKAMFQPEVDSGFIIAYQYSAIMDARTTRVCRYLDRKILRPNSPELDSLSPPNHYNCFVDGQTRIYTVHGWKPIRALEVGDLVLTHAGRFQPVTCVHHKQQPQQYAGDVIKLHVSRPNASGKGKPPLIHTMTVTPDHPVAVDAGWVPAAQVKEGDRVRCLGSACLRCGTITPWLTAQQPKYCSRNCHIQVVSRKGWLVPGRREYMSKIISAQMHREYANGTRGRKKITEKANAATRALYANGKGKGMFQRPEVQEKMKDAKQKSAKWRHAITEGRRGDKNPLSKYPLFAQQIGKRLQAFVAAHPERHGNRVMGRAVMAGHEGYLSKGQRKLYALAQSLSYGVVELEYPIKTEQGLFFVDVALPSLQLGLEFDGSYWHQDVEKDLRRDALLAQEGWKVIRYRDAVPSLSALREDVARLAANHAQQYVWATTTVEKVERWALRKPRQLYNISVLEDESYVAKGFVVHNCRSILTPIFRTEGPVMFASAEEIAQGINLKGKGFCDEQIRHDYFDPNQPRDKIGRWSGEGGALTSGGTGKDREFRDANGNLVTDQATLSRIAGLRIPPMWTDVEVSANPKSELQAVGKDAKGRTQYLYSAEATGRNAAAKFERVAKLAKVYPKLVAGVGKDIARGKEEAIVVGLMLGSAMRVGSAGETLANVKAFGASTLEARHLSVSGNVVHYDFIGKKGVAWKGQIDDPQLAGVIKPLLKGKSGSDRVFSTSAENVNGYLKTYGQFSAKDLRTLIGTSLAQRELKKSAMPTTKTDAKKLVASVAKTVSGFLRNTAAVAKSAYINPIVWAPMEARFGFAVLKTG